MIPAPSHSIPAVLVALATFGAVACTPGEGGGSGEAAAEAAREPAPELSAATSSQLRPEATEVWPPGTDSIPGTPWTQRDWELFQEVLRSAERERLDTLPLGEAIAAMGRLFLGTPYVPRTLEVPGPERLVVNFRGLDCVTLVENVLALTRFSRFHGVSLLDDPPRARAAYERDLSAVRYRAGEPSGYGSRLHYFSEWLTSNADAGRVTLETEALGGTPDPERIDFMSTHAEAYDQLSDPGVLASVRQIESDLNARGPRFVVAQDRISEVAHGIRTGDVIAATSTVGGLDVAHTGFAVWVDGKLHLLHAPLVGSTVVLSERPLAERIAAIGSQDGIMVARPGGPWFGEGG